MVWMYLLNYFVFHLTIRACGFSAGVSWDNGIASLFNITASLFSRLDVTATLNATNRCKLHSLGRTGEVWRCILSLLWNFGKYLLVGRACFLFRMLLMTINYNKTEYIIQYCTMATKTIAVMALKSLSHCDELINQNDQKSLYSLFKY